MSKLNETGHEKNVANLEDLIVVCNGCGASYNPSNSLIKPEALSALILSGQTAIQQVRLTKAAYDNATNNREMAFEPLKKLSTRIMNSMKAMGVSSQTLDDAKTANRKIQGKRAVAVTVDPLAKEAVKTRSVSQQGFDSQIESFSNLVQTASMQASYQPNEEELKITSLNALIERLKAANTAVIQSANALANARDQRDTVLYGDTGIYNVVNLVKAYLKSAFGTDSPTYKQVTALHFRN
ncbi:hypothetical protein GS399_19105 [Pedobacter sp. HMF7647]|uniref:Uncharacterized protein n=1 Tax=Hufsiella arboris TaxID=2695275 RepID=A0A7K1YEQ4_9SPHI|nr:hypothetical protein [Hufsiella arboris]MXV53084.1 hypothetical protein [Hufsiella arboris]